MRLCGRLQFAAGQVFGRVAWAALATITSHAYGDGPDSLSERAVIALTLQQHHRRIREHKASCSVVRYIQTDACYEPGSDEVFSGIGAVLFNPVGARVKFISERLCSEIRNKLNPTNKKTAIYECEFFVFFFVCLVWGPLLSSAVVIYTNNNAARGVLISCGTTNASVLVATLALECDYQLTPCHAKS